MLADDQRPRPYNEVHQLKLIKSSTPIKRLIDPISKNLYHRSIENSSDGNLVTDRLNRNSSSVTSANSANIMNLEKIYPGIYLTSVKGLCSAENLRLFGFTHIIYIDKHIIADDGPTTTHIGAHFNRTTATHPSQHSPSQPQTHNGRSQAGVRHDSNSVGQHRNDHKRVARTAPTTSATSVSASTSTLTSSTSSSSLSSSASVDNATNAASSPSTILPDACTRSPQKNENIFGHNDFETLDLNFGESSYLTTVLPNCYKAVKFIETALKNNGAVLVIDCIGENQKCITIVVGFLMYKYNKNFLTAYQLIKRFHPNIELDRFFITQLYEYEPILQVQRTQSGGNSCSRELRSALLKRKKTHDDFYYHSDTLVPTILPSAFICNGDSFIGNIEQSDILME